MFADETLARLNTSTVVYCVLQRTEPPTFHPLAKLLSYPWLVKKLSVLVPASELGPTPLQLLVVPGRDGKQGPGFLLLFITLVIGRFCACTRTRTILNSN